MRVLFLNRRFETGGGERQLLALLRDIDKCRFTIAVATFYGGGGLSSEFESIPGVKRLPLEKKNRWEVLGLVRRAWSLAREFRPQVIYGYMGPPQILALLVGKLTGTRVVWAVRASNMDLQQYDPLSRFSFWLECRLARFADLIIANSLAGRNYVAAQGFPISRIKVLPNGVDAARFRPDSQSRSRLRAEWGIATHERLIGLVSRIDPMKDHRTFLRAAALLAKDREDVRFVCVGDGPDPYKSEMVALGTNLGLDKRLVWAGERQDMTSVYGSLDIATSASISEGFPNAIGEAMACGIPCVVTDVGDSASIVADTGEVVLPANPAALANGWRQMLDRLASGDYAEESRCVAATRGRILRLFTIEKMVHATEQALDELCQG